MIHPAAPPPEDLLLTRGPHGLTADVSAAAGGASHTTNDAIGIVRVASKATPANVAVPTAATASSAYNLFDSTHSLVDYG